MRQYPRTKFADENMIRKQVEHIRSEIVEFEKECVVIGNPLKNVFLEAHDIIQSAYTLMDILERIFPGQAWSALEEMVEKNERRGYYDKGVFL